MNKEDGTRSAFCSRFENGILVEMDFDAYHVRLIARLIGYKLPTDSVHTYFGKFYFDTNTLTSDQYEQSKQITFRLLYGGIDSEFLSIPFFSEVNAFISNLWSTWKRQGYIETAIDKRPLTRDAFPEMTKNKLFNYYLQSLETEVSVRKLQLLLDHMSGMQSKLILYTYDSMLFDVHPTEYDEFTQSAQSILTTGNLPVKVAKGHIYSKMQEI
jgi:DNA polymerase I-like protein with 3'-5' exonuclease and polymerase domains